MRFSLEHASLVGWLTRRDFAPPLAERDGPGGPWWWGHHRYHRHHHRYFDEPGAEEFKAWRAPRVPLGVLSDFLFALPDSVVTRYPEDADALRRLVGLAQEALPNSNVVRGEDVLVSREVAAILGPLRRWFDLPFYFLPVGSELSLELFRRSPEYTLWLQCADDRKYASARDLLDPFPPLRALFTAGSFAPVTVCWTWAGETVVIPQEVASAERLVRLSEEVPPEYLWTELKRMHRAEAQNFNLLQISDLHFGAREVTPRQLAYVEQHLRERIETTRQAGSVVQPIVTGDLMDTPNDTNLAHFEAFRNRVTDCAGTPVIYIPGNHDMRRKGFLWRNWKALAGLEWKSVVASDVCKVVFVCFDSSKEANLAKGRITDDQFLEVATKLEELKRLRDLSDYMYVSLVHHHPFSTREDEVDTLPGLRIKEEPFLRMENGEQLVRWCAARNVPLILHGHKHRPRFIGQEVEHHGSTRLVRAVGCGSTLGIEGKPLSFNWITWQPATRSWTVSFLADPGDGTGFAEKRLSMGAGPERE